MNPNEPCRRAALAVAAAALLAAGCFDYTEIMPLESNLVGRWIPTAKTAELMRTKGHFTITEHSITVGADRSIVMRNIPDCWRDYPEKPNDMGKLGDWQGTWNLDKHSTKWGLDIGGPGPNGKGKMGYSGAITFKRQKPPYLLALHSGDPDSVIEMDFQREEDGR